MNELDNQPFWMGAFQQPAATSAAPAEHINVPVLEPEEVVLEMGDSFDLDTHRPTWWRRASSPEW